MRIQPINNTYYSKPIQKVDKDNSSTITSFNGLSTSLLLVVAKQGVHGIKGGYNKTKFIECLQTYLNSSSTDKFIQGVAALCKTPDTFFDYEHESWTGFTDLITCFRQGAQELRYIPESRFSTLKKIEKIPDTSYVYIQLKKDLINSFFDNGHEISDLLVKKFAELNDSIYSTFKVEILNKCFSSPLFNNIRKKRLDWNSHTTLYDYEIAKTPCDNYFIFPGHLDKKVEIACDNLSMLATLDKNMYKGYFSHIRPLIDYHKQILDSYAYKTRDDESKLNYKRSRDDYEKKLRHL